MADLRIIITGNVKNLTLNLNKATKSVNKFSRKSKKAFFSLGKSLGVLGKLMGPLGLAGGVAGISIAFMKAAKGAINFEASIARLAIQGDITRKEQMMLGEEITQLAIATGKSRTEIVAAYDAILQRTGKMDLATENMETLAIASLATGAEMTDLAAIAANLSSKFEMSKDDIQEFFDVMIVQGKRGAFTLKDMASQGERVFAAAKNLGAATKKEIGFVTGMLQVVREATGSPEEAVTALENFSIEILRKAGKIRKATSGFNVFEMKDGKKVLKDTRKIIFGIMKGTGADQETLAKLFGKRTLVLMNAIRAKWLESGEEGIDKYVEVQKAQLGVAQRDAARFQETMAGRMGRLGAIFTAMGDKAVLPVLEEMGDALERFLADEENVRLMIEAFEGLGTIIMGTMQAVVFLSKAWGDLADTVASRGLGRAMEMQLDRAEQLGLITPGTKRRALLATGPRAAGGFEGAAGAPLARTAMTAVEALGGRRAGGRQVAIQAEAAISGATAQTQKTPQQIMNELIGGIKVEVNVKNEIDGVPVKSKRTVTTKRGDRTEETAGR